MKVILSIVISLLVFTNVFSQKIKVSSNTGGIAYNASTVSQGDALTANAPYLFAVAFQENYVTKGMVLNELAKKQILNYTFDLEKIVRPTTLGKDSKKIKLASVRVTGNQYTVNVKTVGVVAERDREKFSTSYFNTLKATLAEWGYNVVDLNSSSVFKEKEKVPDFYLAAEITHLAFAAKGKAIQYSVLVDWSLYDILKQEVIYKINTAGYSNSGIPADLTLGETAYLNEFSLALNNSMIGLMTDKEFIKICSENNYKLGPNKELSETLKLPKITPLTFSSNELMTDKSIKSVITIKSEYGHGSGFFISTDGYVLTNSHVVAGSDKIEAIFNNGLILPAVLVAENKKRDVALLKIIGGGYTPLPLNTNMDAVQTGSEVIVIGTPADLTLGQTVTKGIISSSSRIIDGLNHIQTDASINGGNSGGPMLNKNGEVIGIVVAKISGGGFEGLGFAIPINEALKELNILFQ